MLVIPREFGMREKTVDPLDRIRRLTRFEADPTDGSHLCQHYETVLNSCWRSTAPTLGRLTVTTIFDRALIRMRKRDAIFEKIDVLADGISVERMQQTVDTTQLAEVEAGFLQLTDDLLEIITMLTGDILLRQIITGLEGSPKNG